MILSCQNLYLSQCCNWKASKNLIDVAKVQIKSENLHFSEKYFR